MGSTVTKPEPNESQAERLLDLAAQLEELGETKQKLVDALERCRVAEAEYQASKAHIILENPEYASLKNDAARNAFLMQNLEDRRNAFKAAEVNVKAAELEYEHAVRTFDFFNSLK